jgi:hypothetical protein
LPCTKMASIHDHRKSKHPHPAFVEEHDPAHCEHGSKSFRRALIYVG